MHTSNRKVKDQTPSRPSRKPHYNIWENLDQKEIHRIKEHIKKELEHDEQTQKKAAIILEDWIKNNT